MALLAVIAMLIAITPLIAVAVASLISNHFGCVVNEAYAGSCIVMGIEVKDMLYNMSVSFWLMIFTALYIPVAIGLVIASTICWMREKRGDASIKRVGLTFWLLSIGLLLLPFLANFALLILIVTALIGAIIWRRRAAKKENT